MCSAKTITANSKPLWGTVREAGILLLCAIGLAFGFNITNSKSITWIKKEYEKVTATTSDIDKYLPPKATTPADTLATSTPATTPKTSTGVVDKAVVKPVIEKTEPPSFVAEPGVVREITYDQFVRLMASTPYYLIDARGAEKYAESHIGNAVNFYGADVESRIPDLLNFVPHDKVILIYCDGGECELSHHVADVLKQFNYGPIFIFSGGWAEWKKKH
ncbi:MAG: rhodanese-like domain-containing protein [Candidatus Kapabacteria bacterium]|nr:rhodanese-like domain-containing protein [Candidatus Kapabacteria bacterium]